MDEQRLLDFMLAPEPRAPSRKWILGLASNRGRNGGAYERAGDPSILTILARAALIRRGWSEEERIARRRFAETFARR